MTEMTYSCNWTKSIILVFMSLLLWTTRLGAQDMPVPVGVQAALFPKILTFDRNLNGETDNGLVIGVVYQKKFRTSLNVKETFMDALSSAKKRNMLHFHCVPIDISDHTNLEDVISQNKIDILYIAPVRAIEIETITSVSRARKITTLTGVPDYVELGLAVGIGIKGEKPRIIINLPAAKAEGADFKSLLLRMAKVIK